MFLLFRKTFFLDSRVTIVRDLITRNTLEIPDREKYDKIYSMACSCGIVDYLDPIDILNKYDETICANIRMDIEDSRYIEKAIQYSTDSFSVLTERLPPSYTKYFRAGLGFYDEAIALQKYIKHDGDAKSLSQEEYFHIAWPQGVRFRTPIITKDLAIKIFKSEYVYAIGGNPFLKIPSYELPFLHLASLRINEALFMCLDNDLIMITDEDIFDELLSVKVNKVSELIKKSDINNRGIYNYKLNKLTLCVAEEILNCIFEREDFSQHNIEDIISFRIKNKKIFDKLWLKIEQIVTTVQLDASYEEIFKQVHNKFKYDIQELKNGISNAYVSIFGKVLIQSLGTVIPTAITQKSLGLSFETTLITCAIAQISYLTTTGAEQLVNNIKLISKSKGNPYAYLIKAKSKSNFTKKQIVNKKKSIIFEGYIVLSKIELDSPYYEQFPKLKINFRDCLKKEHYKELMMGIYHPNYFSLLSFYKRGEKIFYLMDTSSIANCLLDYKDTISLLRICKKMCIIKPFKAENLEYALQIIHRIAPTIKFDEDLMTRYKFF